VRPLALLCALSVIAAVTQPAHTIPITWQDLTPLHGRLQSAGITAATFPSYVDRVRQDNVRRVRDGDLDHLIFYALQSTHFTTLAPIEPALSAKSLVESGNRIPPDVRPRIRACLKAIESSSSDPRVIYFRALIHSTFPNANQREEALLTEYRRAMKFVYDKEFVAGRAGQTAVAGLYRARGLSTDTEVEAGYVVYTGLGILKSLDPARRIRRVLIVGPGLDLAPRTSLVESGPPESYQPWAVADALLSLGLSQIGDLVLVGADINPRVVGHIESARSAPPALMLVSGIGESPTVHVTDEYREYFAQLGRAIGDGSVASVPKVPSHLSKMVRVRPEIAQKISAEQLDVVTARLSADPFDLIIATNILPYFDDPQLMLAVSNISAMLATGGVFMHNEPRPVLGDITDAVGLRFEQLRRVTIASVTGASGPLTDVILLHRKSGTR
jgi:hypothetical protein